MKSTLQAHISIFGNTKINKHIYCDTKNTTSRYYLNGRDQGIAFDNVSLVNDEQCTMAVSLTGKVTVKLLDFKGCISELYLYIYCKINA